MAATPETSKCLASLMPLVDNKLISVKGPPVATRMKLVVLEPRQVEALHQCGSVNGLYCQVGVGVGGGFHHLQVENEVGERVARNREFQIAERRLPALRRRRDRRKAIGEIKARVGCELNRGQPGLRPDISSAGHHVRRRIQKYHALVARRARGDTQVTAQTHCGRRSAAWQRENSGQGESPC
jgi:hypothetical protein